MLKIKQNISTNWTINYKCQTGFKIFYWKQDLIQYVELSQLKRSIALTEFEIRGTLVPRRHKVAVFCRINISLVDQLWVLLLQFKKVINLRFQRVSANTTNGLPRLKNRKRMNLNRKRIYLWVVLQMIINDLKRNESKEKFRHKDSNCGSVIYSLKILNFMKTYWKLTNVGWRKRL